MANRDDQWSKIIKFFILLNLIFSLELITLANGKRLGDDLTACQHLRRVEFRRAKSLTNQQVRIPRCTKVGAFEPIQCLNETANANCWCVDEYGIEVPGTYNEKKEYVKCEEPKNCPASNCRMFCSSGFARDAQSGCTICRCRDPCNGVDCPNGQVCQQQEVKCKTEPCPPVPTCKKARNLANYCPSGMPLSIPETTRPFLCGIDPGKPQCPPLYQCMVDSGNDYGVCCPNSLKFQKPGVCPNPDQTRYTESTGYLCGTPCTHDLECNHMEKCCYMKGCTLSCQQPHNVTTCHQAKALSEVLSINEREGRGYVPDCNGPGGMFAPKQCSRNGLVCWCVDPRTGHKIRNTMGQADFVECDSWENMIARSLGRSIDAEQCDTNICAAICEYGFKNDHNNCPTCECSDPCEGFKCLSSSHCEVATDPLCSGLTLCASWPICKPDLVYSNPCEIGTPLADNITGEIMYCMQDERQSRMFQTISFFGDVEEKQGRALTNRIFCPANYKCIKLHGEAENICCPTKEAEIQPIKDMPERQQSMCEYLRDFSERMEGTEEGMQLAISAPKCSLDGGYEARQCSLKKVQVTRKEQKKILEENTIRKMRMLLNTRQRRETVKLYRVDDNALNIRVAAPVMGRSAKVISMSVPRGQDIAELFETEVKKVAPAMKKISEDELVEMEVEECWCVDGFGTEIPESRGFNVTDKDCLELRESIDCLDLTCRMGCEYGFILDPISKCPACQCRDPCDGVICGDSKECRNVEVSCDDEYCPSVPACLPRKPGQCPFLVPPGANSESNSCDYECRTDTHCEGNKRCCSNGCGTQCVEPQMKTACQHLKSIQMHQTSELGIPPKQIHIAQCDDQTGKWKSVQCGPDNICWCVDDQGQEISGTRTKNKLPTCKTNSALQCPMQKCKPCEHNFYRIDKNGCQTCECKNLCDEISCLGDEECQLIKVECIDEPCPKMPICVPKRESICPEGTPLKQADLEVVCGPHNENEACPTTHTCQLNPVTNRGACCAKTRDVCFDSIESSCLSKSPADGNLTKWRFSPKANKCLSISVTKDEGKCQSKNLFHSELACNSVCPVLTQCERLKLKNSLAARRTGHSSVWFQPRCDPVTGHWSPIQCLGKQPSLDDSSSNRLRSLSRAFSYSEPELDESQNGVCWCSDKKGAPLKGTLTRSLEPICNHRQARRRMHSGEEANDPLMEQLIQQMTMLSDMDQNELEIEEEPILISNPEIAITERIIELSNSIISSKLSVTESTKTLLKTTTRCRALKTAPFPVACDEAGAFLPTQCNDENQCWCVDTGGNQLPSSDIFKKGSKTCKLTPVDSVFIELNLQNESNRTIINLYDVLKIELRHLIGDALENLRVQENLDGSVIVRFELHNENKIDSAFALEETVKNNKLVLGYGNLKPDITMSSFIHNLKTQNVIQAKLVSSENTLHTVVFILATSSAFLISIFVVYIMLMKRTNKQKIIQSQQNFLENRILGADKYIDFNSPIFILSPSENNKLKSIDTIDTESAGIK